MNPPKKRTKRKPEKTHVARKPHEVVEYKERFINQLLNGLSPGAAARKIGISHQTAYNWKNDDAEFATDWKAAVETALDVLESSLYQSGLAGNSSDAQFILKYRRYNLEHRTPQNFILNISLEEHTKRLIRLGLPVPQIEGDYEPEDYEDASTGNS